MITEIFAKDFTDKLKELPAGWVFFALKAEDGYLYAGISNRLQARISSFLQKADDDSLFDAMISESSHLEYLVVPDSFTALVHLKCFTQAHAPRYQYRITPYSDYVYLALDAQSFPFVSLQNHTNDDMQYIGPFRSRFMLADVVDSVSRILKLPYCETGTYPCEKFDRDICRGWCLALAPAAESEDVQDLAKLDTLLKEAFVHPNNGILELIQKQRDEYFNDLEFTKADLLDDEIRLLTKYRDWLNFLYVAKDLGYESEELSIQHGQIVRVIYEGREFHFPCDNPEYRDDELLACPLAAVDEMNIVYNFIREIAHAR